MATLSEWKLTSQDGKVDCSLPYTMLFIGRADCDINMEAETIDKRHALITFDHYQNKFKVKDLGTANGTYINDRRIPDQTFITIEEGDAIQLGNECAPLQVEKSTQAALTAITQCHAAERPPLPVSHTLDRLYVTGSSSSSNHSLDDITHSQPMRSSSRPLWDRRPCIAECQGCIREQDLHHTCGVNSEHTPHLHNEVTGEVRASPVSPVNLRNQRQSPKSTSQMYFHSFASEDGRENSLNKLTNKDEQVIRSAGEKMTTCVSNTHNIEITTATKRGTPLYGQPSWWGESGADEHNKRLLKDMQRQVEEGKVHQKELEEDRNCGSKSQNGLGNTSTSSVETGGDSSKGLSFTVDLADSLEENSMKAEMTAAQSSGDKLSNFLPENLRKSFKDRQDRLAQPVDRSSENSPAAVRRSRSPAKGQSSSNSDKHNMFLINKMLHSTPKSSDLTATDDQTEYSMYPEARVINRSSTMPELIHPQGEGAERQLSKSRTSDSLMVDNTDKVSESGTYTIDEDNKELEKAREDIDRLFGVDRVSLGSPSLEIVESPENHLELNDSLQVEVGSSEVEDTITAQVDNHATMNKEGSSPQELLREIATDSPTFHNNNDILVGKPPLSPPIALEQGDRSPSLRGRRLPAVPHTGRRGEELRHSMEVAIGKSNTMPKRKKEVQHSKEKILQELGIGETPVIEKERPKLVEELLTSRTYHRDNDPIIVNKTTFFDKIISSTALPSPEQSKELPQLASADGGGVNRSSRVGGLSVDSVNTDVLLQSTDEFMKAIHSFSSESEASGRQGNSLKSSGTASKPTTRQSNSLRKSTADRLSANNKLNNAGSYDSSTSRKPTATKEPTRRSVADTVTSRLSGAKRSQSKDPENGDSAESLNNKPVSTNRVGPLSSSRPNRTFELRRARTESLESDSSVSSTPRTNGTRRSARSLDNTEVSLGARIVQKSRETGAVMDPPRSAPIRRSDGGRYSMRATSTTSKTSGAKSSTPVSSKQSSGKKLPSRPGSNSMIAKAEREKEAGKERDKAAWDRRRTYDPRKAVQEAKARKPDSRGGTPSSAEESSTCSSSRPRANSYSEANSNRPVEATPSNINEPPDTRHSADVFHPMESDLLKLNLQQENTMEDSHELEIAQLSHNLAKDLEMLSTADSEPPNRYKPAGSREKIGEPSPETDELIESMFACQQQKSAFSSYRSAASVTPEIASPALSPMKKKLSTSQHFENGSSSNVDHSYNDLVLTSIQRLSAKLQGYTSNTVGRLRENGLTVSASPSPTEEMKGDEMPASSTLASILKTLKTVERNCKVMDKALFTSSLPQSDLSTVSNNEHEHYLAEIKRIRNEIAGFRPIEDSSKGAKSSAATSKLTTNNNTKPAASRTRTSHTSTGTSSYKQRPVYY